MSRENVEFVLRGYAAYNAGDREPKPWYFHEDAEYHVSSADPDTAVHRGLPAIQGQYARWEEAYPDLRVEPLETVDCGEVVLVWVRFTGHGAVSGIPIDMELAHVHSFREGKVARIAEYMDREEALRIAREARG